MLLIIAWACVGLIMAIARPHASITLMLCFACLIAATVLYILGPGGPNWRS